MMNKKSHLKYDITDIIKNNVDLEKDELKIIQKLTLPDNYEEKSSGEVKRGVVIDVEATGLSIGYDDVIQLALLPFEYELPSGKIIKVLKEEIYEGLREPNVPITEEASLITGITNEMVKNKDIDTQAVEEIIGKANIIIAHNAFFDRPMVEQHWDCFKSLPWSCTFSSINWLKEGFSSAKLELLGINFGWYYDGHTALNDCEACLALLSETLPITNQTVFNTCRQYAINKSYLIRAIDAPYDKRQLLRRRRYKWRPADKPNGKVWWTELSSFKEETMWLNSKIYDTRINIPIKEITALERYSDRIWEFD